MSTKTKETSPETGNNANEELPAGAEQQPSVDELQATIKSLSEVLTAQDLKIKELQEQNAALVANQNEAAAATDTFTFKVGGRTYKVVHGVQAPDEGGQMIVLRPAQIAENKTIREHLVEIGSSAVAKV